VFRTLDKKLDSGIDIWLGDQIFKFQFPSLFNIVCKRHATVAEVFSTSPLNISFRRALVGDKLHGWLRLVNKLLNVNLQEGWDTFTWSLQANDSFKVHSMYKNHVNSGIKVTQEIWHAKIPLKIKIFMCYLKRDVLLTKDNLARRNWLGSKICSFCTPFFRLRLRLISLVCNSLSFWFRTTKGCR